MESTESWDITLQKGTERRMGRWAGLVRRKTISPAPSRPYSSDDPVGIGEVHRRGEKYFLISSVQKCKR